MKSTYLNGNATECSVLSHPPVLLNSSRPGPTHDFQIHSNILFKVDKSASTPITAAAIARMVSTVLMPGRAAIGAGAGRGAAGAAERATAGAAAVARGALGGAAGAAGPAAGAAGAGAGPPLGPPGGSVGNLMVGAAEGLGGRLMRTVSFLGWTFPVSFLGGTAPLGMLGIFSAIKCILIKTKVTGRECQTLPTLPVPSSA
jgi:hypothetical protein